MADIYLHGRQLESIFELLGEKENDITYSIGWTLASSHAFLKAFIKRTLPNTLHTEDAIIRLQEFKHDSGITDIEIQGRGFHIVVEAKRGWTLPGTDQLNLYAKRLNTNSGQQNLIVVMSECSQEYASLHIPKMTQNVPLQYFSWKDTALMTKKVQNASHAEKRLLEQLRIYLRRIVNMQNQESNMVYVVSLGSNIPEGCSISWIDIVEKKKCYFYPVGKGWPSPPNYLGFRYKGKLQRIHHVESWKIVDDLHSDISEIPDGLWQGSHYICTLGPAIVPKNDVKTGNVYPSGRIWAMLDLLLTSKTISAARDLTQKRLSEDK